MGDLKKKHAGMQNAMRCGKPNAAPMRAIANALNVRNCDE
jgi:hypothetical protein